MLCAQTISRPQLLTDTLQYYFPTCLFPDGRDESSRLIFNSHGWRMGDGQKEIQPKEKQTAKAEMKKGKEATACKK